MITFGPTDPKEQIRLFELIRAHILDGGHIFDGMERTNNPHE